MLPSSEMQGNVDKELVTEKLKFFHIVRNSLYSKENCIYAFKQYYRETWPSKAFGRNLSDNF